MVFSKNDDCKQKTRGNYSITEDELVRRALDAYSYLPNLRSVIFCEKYPVLDQYGGHAVGQARELSACIDATLLLTFIDRFLSLVEIPILKCYCCSQVFFGFASLPVVEAGEREAEDKEI